MIMMLFFLVFVVVGVVAIAKYRASLLDDLGSSNGSAARDALLAELLAHDAASRAAAAALLVRGETVLPDVARSHGGTTSASQTPNAHLARAANA